MFSLAGAHGGLFESGSVEVQAWWLDAWLSERLGASWAIGLNSAWWPGTSCSHFKKPFARVMRACTHTFGFANGDELRLRVMDHRHCVAH
eukprot:scaffold22474_cov14-Tisochrysis_lutea.AAC.2